MRLPITATMLVLLTVNIGMAAGLKTTVEKGLDPKLAMGMAAGLDPATIEITEFTDYTKLAAISVNTEYIDSDMEFIGKVFKLYHKKTYESNQIPLVVWKLRAALVLNALAEHDLWRKAKKQDRTKFAIRASNTRMQVDRVIRTILQSLGYRLDNRIFVESFRMAFGAAHFVE